MDFLWTYCYTLYTEYQVHGCGPVALVCVSRSTRTTAASGSILCCLLPLRLNPVLLNPSRRGKQQWYTVIFFSFSISSQWCHWGGTPTGTSYGLNGDIYVYHLWFVCVFSLGYSSAQEWLEPVLWPRTWLLESMWEQQGLRLGLAPWLWKTQ